MEDDINSILAYSVRELHIDLLFLEEFFSSSVFRTWFISNTINENNVIDLVCLGHSVYELERESDLEVSFHSPKGEIIFLIENKINAQFQPNQAADYQRRGEEYVRRGKCSEAYTVLFAPENYIHMIKANHKFDYYISFEEMIQFYRTQDQMGDRAIYKIEVLKRAIKKLSAGHTTYSNQASYQPTDVNQGITAFWERYWQDVSVRYPELYMPRPGEKGPASTFIGLAKKFLPPRVIIYHKFVHGYVDLQFDSLGKNVDLFINACKREIEEEMVIQQAGKSAVVVRIEVPKINPHMFFEDIVDDVHKGQDAAKRLLDWFNCHAAIFADFQRI